KGYYADFNGIEHLAKSYTDAYVYTGTFSEERNRTFGKAATGHPGKQFIVFSQNHDQIGNRMLGERSAVLYSHNMQKLLAAAVLSAPFLPMLFMGEEWGADSPFLYFVSHTDPELVELVRKGRKAEFAAMHNEGEAPDPQSEETFNKSKLNWSSKDDSQHASIYKFYQALIALRKNNLCLKMCDREATHVHLFKEQNTIILERGLTGSKDLLVCVLNFSGSSQSLPVPKGLNLTQMLLDSSAGIVSVSGNAATDSSITTLNVQPESFIAYSATYV
ncbi:MAG TPA: malto-oligosyltrehalose trehalohydrolase, partial [Pedobacter sp.]